MATAFVSAPPPSIQRRPLTEADAVDIWIARWLKVRRRDLDPALRLRPAAALRDLAGRRFRRQPRQGAGAFRGSVSGPLIASIPARIGAFPAPSTPTSSPFSSRPQRTCTRPNTAFTAWFAAFATGGCSFLPCFRLVTATPPPYVGAVSLMRTKFEQRLDTGERFMHVLRMFSPAFDTSSPPHGEPPCAPISSLTISPSPTS